MSGGAIVEAETGGARASPGLSGDGPVGKQSRAVSHCMSPLSHCAAHPGTGSESGNVITALVSVPRGCCGGGTREELKRGQGQGQLSGAWSGETAETS